MFSTPKLVGLFTTIVVALSLGGCAETGVSARTPHHGGGSAHVMAANRVTGPVYVPAAIPQASVARAPIGGTLNVAPRPDVAR